MDARVRIPGTDWKPPVRALAPTAALREHIDTSDRPFGLPSDEALIEEFNRRVRDGECRS